MQLPAADSLDGQALINFHQNLTAQTNETNEKLDRLRCAVRHAARSCAPAEAEAAATKTLADELDTLDLQPAASVIERALPKAYRLLLGGSAPAAAAPGRGSREIAAAARRPRTQRRAPRPIAAA